ncbi:MAG: hypothetical protein IJB79_02105 [Candidatus Gastranaerophilales bacterium]|nr:hypothetical protein [Candidatus Gastranaerophilales bacterium]
MQITSIQNIFRNNFQYKNNSAKSNPINFKGQDTFERNIGDDVAVSRKYYRGKQEFSPDMFMQSGNRLFIKGKDSYIPYGACLDEYNAKGEIIRHTTYNNGAKFIINRYKNGELVQEDRYEDVFNKASISKKRTTVRKFDGFNPSGTKYNVPFAISRNHGKDWKNNPTIAMRKNGKNDSLLVYFAAPSDEKRGKIEITYFGKSENSWFETPIYDEGEYLLKISPNKSTNETALLALEELKEILQNEEFRADFGDNDIFNSELNKAIKFLSSKINED